MKISRNHFLILSAAALLAGCNPSTAEKIDEAVYNHTVSNNPCAASEACSAVFDEALKKYKQSPTTELCDELEKRSDVDLAVCEVDIRDDKYREMLSSCKVNLLSRLIELSQRRSGGILENADFSNLERKPIQHSQMAPRTQVQLRDLTNGYFATSGDVKAKQVILSFDDGPDPENSVSILRTLARFGIKAHFFQVGKRVQISPETTQLIASEGHSIGNHSWNHPNMRKLSFEESVSQIKRTHEIIYKVLGWVDPLYRFPYGNNTKELDAMLFQNQMADMKWTIDSNDWKMVNADKSLRTNIQVVNDVMDQLDKRGRGMILFHDVHRRTAELLPEVLQRITEKGYTTVILQPTNQKLKTKPVLLYGQDLP